MIIDYTLLTLLAGALVLGITSGVLGCFALLRKESLLVDAISHAALPGIALSFLWTMSNNPFILLTGGAFAGAIGALMIALIVKGTTLKKDTALGLVLSVFFGLGLVLLTIIQKKECAQQAVLNKFLFGNASTLLRSEVAYMFTVSSIIFCILYLCWKEFIMFLFDPFFMKNIGYNILFVEILLTMLLILSIVIGLQTVGVVLMSAMFVAPAAAAKQWTHKVSIMLFLSALFAALSGVVGVIISSNGDRLPTGPVMVVVMSSIIFLSITLSPYRYASWSN